MDSNRYPYVTPTLTLTNALTLTPTLHRLQMDGVDANPNLNHNPNPNHNPNANPDAKQAAYGWC